MYAALDAIGPDEGLLQSKLRALMVGYHLRFRAEVDRYRITHVEEFTGAGLINISTGARSKTFAFGGVMDVELFDGDQPGVMDHKTTSDSIENPDSPYWRQLVVESQIDHYMLLKHAHGERVMWAVWDVVKKPTISPRQITKAEMVALVETRTWCGIEMEDEAIEEAQLSGRETFALYEARLVNDCSEVRPEAYFQRRRIPRMDSQLAEYATELWDLGQEIIQARRNDRHPRNSGACMLYGSPCKFLGVCSGHDSIDSANWQWKAFVHAEIKGFDDGEGGRSLLTNSRLRTFQTCRRKHFYQYELGVERVQDDERESLIFGQAWHHAMAAYFTQIKEQGNVEFINDEAAKVIISSTTTGEAVHAG